MKNKFYSPLRYPGGKTKLAPFVKELFYENKLVDFHYLEPFAGGAGLALSLLFEKCVKTITINDYDRSIYAFWHSIVYENKKFLRKIKQTAIDLDTWKLQHQVQRNKKSSNLFDLGFSTFFLNRTNVSGIITGGIIGGKNQMGRYKIDARFNKDSLIERIRLIGDHRDKITVTCGDALQILKEKHNDTFIYIDPPYVEKAKFLYMNIYKEEDHRNISKALLSNHSEYFWLLSYDTNILIDELYNSCRNKLSWKVRYSSSNIEKEENLFLHPKLKFEISKGCLEPNKFHT